MFVKRTVNFPLSLSCLKNIIKQFLYPGPNHSDRQGSLRSKRESILIFPRTFPSIQPALIKLARHR